MRGVPMSHPANDEATDFVLDQLDEKTRSMLADVRRTQARLEMFPQLLLVLKLVLPGLPHGTRYEQITRDAWELVNKASEI